MKNRNAMLLIGTLLIIIICFYLIGTNEDPSEDVVTDVQSSLHGIKERLADVERYTYYLDKGNHEIGQKMKAMDLVIVEPIEMQARYSNEAQENGTLLYGYVNAMEGDKWNKELFEQFVENDFYKDEKGERVYFEQWDSYMMDMTSAHYQELLLKEVDKRIVQRKLDGVFFDTVGNIDSYIAESDKNAQREALVQVMLKIKQQYKDLSIAQNWGFDTLVDYTAPYVDFIMWEDFSYDHVGHEDWSQEKMKELKKVRDEFGTQIMVVAFSENGKSKSLAKKHNFKYMYNPDGSYYNKWHE
ncbi:endo alpha-1,4 polygalactosaminidase [Sporosarcina sp.]|uniref:putative glycoside hydrolase n=1 Tax=Sporosarcina sp. TaxID=49982 RepID=UPI0026180AAD|nr:endo alpha-1,4 polygalactosaminidase [Sporosarcina sp.]